MSKFRPQYREQIKKLLKDGAEIIPVGDYDNLIDRGLEIYSRKVSRVIVIDLTSDGSGEFPVSALTGFDEEFSGDPEIEYPISTSGEPNMIDRREWRWYRKPEPTGQVIRFASAPSNGSDVRFTFKVPHVVTETTTTVKQSDFHALAKLMAAEGCDDLSQHYRQTSEKSIINADMAIYQTKSSEYANGAKAYRKQFYEHIGVSEDKGTPAASVTKNWDTKSSDGGSRITHPRRRR